MAIHTLRFEENNCPKKNMAVGFPGIFYCFCLRVKTQSDILCECINFKLYPVARFLEYIITRV